MPQSSSTASGRWIESLFQQMAFQVDDRIAAEAVEEGLSDRFTSTINGVSVSRTEFIQRILGARQFGRLVLEKSEEVIHSPPPPAPGFAPGPDDGADGLDVVGHVQSFRIVYNDDSQAKFGKGETLYKAMMLCSVEVSSDSERHLVRMEEVMTPL